MRERVFVSVDDLQRLETALFFLFAIRGRRRPPNTMFRVVYRIFRDFGVG